MVEAISKLCSLLIRKTMTTKSKSTKREKAKTKLENQGDGIITSKVTNVARRQNKTLVSLLISQN